MAVRTDIVRPSPPGPRRRLDGEPYVVEYIDKSGNHASKSFATPEARAEWIRLSRKNWFSKCAILHKLIGTVKHFGM